MLSEEIRKSAAYKALKTSACREVLEILINKPGVKEYIRGSVLVGGEECKPYSRKAKRLMKKHGCKPTCHIDENLRVFLQKDAEEIYNIKTSRFRTAIADLMAKGFINLAPKKGKKRYNRYFLSGRWKKYGTKDFSHSDGSENRVKSKGGFQKGNQYGRNCSPEKKAAWDKQKAEEKEQWKREMEQRRSTILRILQPKIDKLKQEHKVFGKSLRACRRLHGDGSSEVAEIIKRLSSLSRQIGLAESDKETWICKTESYKETQLRHAKDGK